MRHGQCQLCDTVLPTPVRLTRRALEGGSAAPSNPSLVNLQGQTMTSGRRERHPRPCSATPGTATTTPALLGTRGRDATTPATLPRTDHRQRLPRARLRTPRPTATPSPSKPPLFKYGTRHDDKTGARAARTATNSLALHTIPPPVDKQCGMPVNHPSLIYKRKVIPLAARDIKSKKQHITHTLLLPRYRHSITPLGTWRPHLLSRLACSRPTTGTPVQSNTMPRAHHCWTYGPGRNQDKPRVFSCLAPTIEG
jgi:hypothetical protein